VGHKRVRPLIINKIPRARARRRRRLPGGLTGKVRHTEPAFGGEYLGRARFDLGSALLAVLLLLEVACSLLGAGTIFFVCIVLAWLVLPAVVGFKNVLDAGCLFMIVSLGIVVVVHVAVHGPVLLMP
jgi:hypothetical protein